MALHALEHFLVLTDDLQATRDLYRDVLGIPVSSRSSGTGALDHLAFQATDFDAFVANLQVRGVEAHRHDTPAIGLRQLFLFDPNGIKLEINFLQRR